MTFPRRPTTERQASIAAMDATHAAAHAAQDAAYRAWAGAMTYADACAVQAIADAAWSAHHQASEQYRKADDADWQWVKRFA